MVLRKITKPDPVFYDWNGLQIEVFKGRQTIDVHEPADGSLSINFDGSLGVKIFPTSLISVPGRVKSTRSQTFDQSNGSEQILPELEENLALVPKDQRRVLLFKRAKHSVAYSVRRARRRLKAHPYMRPRVLGILHEYTDPLTVSEIVELLGSGTWNVTRRAVMDLVYECLLLLRNDGIVQAFSKNQRFHFYIYRPDLFHTLNEPIEGDDQIKVVPLKKQQSLPFGFRQLVQKKAPVSKIRDPRLWPRPGNLPFDKKVQQGQAVERRFPTLRKQVIQVLEQFPQGLSGVDIARSLPRGPWSVLVERHQHTIIRRFLCLLAHEGRTKFSSLDRTQFDGSRGNPVIHTLVK